MEKLQVDSTPPPLKITVEPSFLQGNRVVYDIVDGNPVFEQKKEAAKNLRETLARVVAHKGADFAHLTINDLRDSDFELPDSSHGDNKDKPSTQTDKPRPGTTMSYEELATMRQDVLVKLDIAAGELSQALDVVNLILSVSHPEAPSPHQVLPTASLGATFVTPPEEKASVNALNAQLVVGTKDRALRNASNILSRAAETVGTFVERGEVHWGQAILIRRANWGLLPKPLQPGLIPVPQHKDVDHSSRDFVISFGLEDSPPQFRRRALASLSETSTLWDDTDALVFSSPHRRRLRVGLTSKGGVNNGSSAMSAIDLARDTELGMDPLNARLSAAQREIVEEELFSELIKEAGSFPSAAAFLSERKICIEAAKDLELTLELVDIDGPSNIMENSSHEPDSEEQSLCSLILHTFMLLLLRYHRHQRALRRVLPTSGQLRPLGPGSPFVLPHHRPPAILAPIISLLQYRSFCLSMRSDLDKARKGLLNAGIPCIVMFTGVGENAADVLSSLDVRPPAALTQNEPSGSHNSWLGLEVSGEAMLWIDNRYSLRFTFASPTVLTLHLPHATLPITNLSTMRRLLLAEVGMRLLMGLKDKGERTWGGRWSLDRLDPRCTAEWEVMSLQLEIVFDDEFRPRCIASIGETGPEGTTSTRVEEYAALDNTATVAGTGSQTLKTWFKSLGRLLRV